MVFRLALDRFTCFVHDTITHVNNLFPDFRCYMLFSFVLKTAKIMWNTSYKLFSVQQKNNDKVSFVFRSRKDSKRCRFFPTYVISRKRRANQRKKHRSNVSWVRQGPHARIQLFLNTFKMAKKSRLCSCTRPFNYTVM